MWWEYLGIARRAIAAHRFRSALTMSSITIGALSIVLMSSLAQSGLATLSRGIEEMGGSRLIMITGKRPERAEAKTSVYGRGLTVEDRDLLTDKLPHIEAHGVFHSPGRKRVASDQGDEARTSLLVGNGSVLHLFGMRLARGRMFTEEENRQHARLCVVGHKLAQKIFDGESVGRWLAINVSGRHMRCRVIGQLADQERMGINFGFDWRDLVLVPIDAAIDYDSRILASANLVLRTDGVSHNEPVKRIANALLVERHHGIDDFQIWDFSRFLAKFHRTFALMEAIVGLLASIALLVGGVGVMNMMLVSVSERVREIGIRKALGASPSAIRAQFLIEAIVLAGSGGLLGVGGGIALGAATGPLIRMAMPTWVGVVAHGAAIVALVVCFAIGLLFGLLPATRAARLDPVEAIRR